MSFSKTLRSALERLSRNRAFRKRLPERFARRPIWVSGDARLRFLLPGERGFDQDLLAYVERHVSPGDCVWDIGANVGQFALAAAQRSGTGHVFAFEPDPFMRHLLDRTVADPGNRDLRSRMTVVGLAVTGRVGFVQLTVAERGRAATHLSAVPGHEAAGSARYEVTVPASTVDALLEEFAAPHLVKIDVEGAEAEVLAGAARLLREVRPRFVIEVHARNVASVSKAFRDNNYALFDPLTGGKLDACAFNTFAIPR